MGSWLARILGTSRLFNQGPSGRGRFADDWDRLRESADTDRERAEIDAIFSSYADTEERPDQAWPAPYAPAWAADHPLDLLG